MGFLDFLFDKEAAEKKKIAKMQKTVTNMYVQPQERQYTLQTLRDIGTPEAIRAMLARFGESAPNTTVDGEEKEYVYDIMTDMCRHNPQTIDILVDHIRASESKINWPIKILQDIYDYNEMSTFLKSILESCDTEYQRDPEKKQEVILRAAEFEDEDLAKEVARFVDDQNETVRFLTVETLLQQGFEDISVPALRKVLADEDSLRIVQKVSEAFAANQSWTIPEDEREAIELALPEEYALHKSGYIHKKRT